MAVQQEKITRLRQGWFCQSVVTSPLTNLVLVTLLDTASG